MIKWMFWKIRQKLYVNTKMEKHLNNLTSLELTEEDFIKDSKQIQKNIDRISEKRLLSLNLTS